MNPARRTLNFTSLDQVLPDVEGHTTVGQWSLGQVCNHLALTGRLSMDGFPDKFPWLERRTLVAANAFDLRVTRRLCHLPRRFFRPVGGRSRAVRSPSSPASGAASSLACARRTASCSFFWSSRRGGRSVR